MSRASRRARSNRLSAGWFNKDPPIILVIQKTAEGNIVKTVDAIQALLAGDQSSPCRRT